MEHLEKLENLVLEEDGTKLRMTKKQFIEFKNACLVLGILSTDKRFIDVIKTIVGDVKTTDIMSGFVNPIINVPKRVPKRSRKKADQTPGREKKESYFTKGISATERSKLLYSQVSAVEGLYEKFWFKDQKETTCIVDLRSMLYAYLKSDDMNEKFLKTIVPDTVKNYGDKGVFSRQFIGNAAIELSKE
jgi:hypothetical protein